MKKIRVFVDKDEEPDEDPDLQGLVTRGARPRSYSVGERVISIASQTLTQQLSDILDPIVEAISTVGESSGSFLIDEVKFTIAIDATGEVGILSVAKGSLSGKTGLEFILKRVVEKDGE